MLCSLENKEACLSTSSLLSHCFFDVCTDSTSPVQSVLRLKRPDSPSSFFLLTVFRFMTRRSVPFCVVYCPLLPHRRPSIVALEICACTTISFNLIVPLFLPLAFRSSSPESLQL